jgi:4-carboxymuconolactone decarboxylase
VVVVCDDASMLIMPLQRDDLASQVASEYLAETCFASYARPGLAFRDRSLMNIAMLIALNRAPELRIHILAALRNGLSEEQICEACRHAMVYCGVPAGRNALLVASDVFDELRQREAEEKAKASSS